MYGPEKFAVTYEFSLFSIANLRMHLHLFRCSLKEESCPIKNIYIYNKKEKFTSRAHP